MKRLVLYALAWFAVSIPLLASPQLAWAQGKAPPVPKGAQLQPGVSVGLGQAFANLTVFPVYALVQEKIGEFTTLELAIGRSQAEVREQTGGAQVNQLVIENKGKQTILVLAGTVVKGGNQDRQVAQDFVISGKTTVPIDAFCVEQGRWRGARQGKATGGKFTALDTLAHSKVRAAGQYKGDQQQVWKEVSKVNRANGKTSSSGTLAATLDDKAIKARRKQLAKQVVAYVDQLQAKDQVVGLAYAVNGKIRGVRWFMNRQLFDQHRATLVNTAVVEAMTGQARRGATPKAAPPKAVGPAAVAKFVREIAASKQRQARATKAANTNHYRTGKKGAGSRAMMPAAPGAKPKAVTADYAAF
ncbi:MAG: hypothetical protein JRI68_24080 [Deltaproteobacteria bacterium]|nr:hypothetical protein [Deltaproteobacteria bacterium]